MEFFFFFFFQQYQYLRRIDALFIVIENAEEHSHEIK